MKNFDVILDDFKLRWQISVTLLPGEFHLPEFSPQSYFGRRADSRWVCPTFLVVLKSTVLVLHVVCCVVGHRKPSKMYSRSELKRDARKTFKTIRKLVGNRHCRKDLKMVND